MTLAIFSAIVLMVRERVVAFRNADLLIGAAAEFAPDHEGDDPREIGLIREHLQIEHHPRMLGEGFRNAGGPFELRQLAVDLRFDQLHAALHVADRVEILGDLQLIGRTELGLQAFAFFVTESRMLRSCLMRCRRTAGSVLSESPNRRSNTTRGRFSIGIGVRRRAPADGVHIGAGISGFALAQELGRIHAEFERGELVLAADLLRGDLVHRDAGQRVRALGLPRMHAGEIARAGAGMIARVLALLRAAAAVVRKTRDHEHAVLERGKRLHDRLQLVVRADRVRRPLIHHDAVRQVDDGQPRRRLRRLGARKSRHHRIEKRKRQRRAETAQHGAPVKGLFGDDHHGSRDLLIWNGALFTIASTSDDHL